MSLLTEALEPNNLRSLFGAGGWVADVAKELREDARFAGVVRRGLLPLPFDPAQPHGEVFPPFRPLSVPALRGKRIGLVASGGSGALASLCGVRRALEEAGLDVVAISACSGANFFASLWAFGFSAQQMADFWLGLRVSDYVDMDWRAFARASLRRFRDFGGMLKGDAIERTFRDRFGDRALGDANIPLWVIAWNIDQNRVAYLGTTTTPDLPLARAVRVAMSIPLFIEPVRIAAPLYGDGGVVSLFPARPLVDLDPPLPLLLR
jgi:NTE family protein